ncbi:MAG TPA: ABC transporter permease [Verrucomicrobiae bacterium]|nr:ABC transporter permease [Verrucomicrobiae bacterium]
MLNILATLLGNTLLYATPLIFAALGGVFSERSGVVNIGLEGMMTIGAFGAAVVSLSTGNPWLGLLVGMLAGGVLALLHAVASVSFRADQVVSGVAINFMANGFSMFMLYKLYGGGQSPHIETKLVKIAIPGLAKIPYIGDAVFNNYPTVYLAFLATFLGWLVLYKTAFGLRVRAVGEHPLAVDTVGVNVYLIRYICVVISGFLAGLGGAAVSIGIIAEFTEVTIAGQGFIALAAMIFGKWTPWGALGACLFFGAANALDAIGQSIGLTKYVNPAFFSMLPYVLTIIALVGFIGRANAPAADGKPYEKGKHA